MALLPQPYSSRTDISIISSISYETSALSKTLCHSESRWFRSYIIVIAQTARRSRFGPRMLRDPGSGTSPFASTTVLSTAVLRLSTNKANRRVQVRQRSCIHVVHRRRSRLNRNSIVRLYEHTEVPDIGFRSRVSAALHRVRDRLLLVYPLSLLPTLRCLISLTNHRRDRSREDPRLRFLKGFVEE